MKKEIGIFLVLLFFLVMIGCKKQIEKSSDENICYEQFLNPLSSPEYMGVPFKSCICDGELKELPRNCPPDSLCDANMRYSCSGNIIGTKYVFVFEKSKIQENSSESDFLKNIQKEEFSTLEEFRYFCQTLSYSKENCFSALDEVISAENKG